MTEQEYFEGEESIEPRETVVGGVVLSEDDLEVGQLVCVYNMKMCPDEPNPIMGHAMQIKALCLPFFLVELLDNPERPIMTLDTRFLSMMKVTPEYASVQAKAWGEQTPIVQPKKVRKPAV